MGFSKIAFSKAVRATQTRYGARAQNLLYGLAADGNRQIGDAVRRYIEATDTFFMASASTDGWPYVQHRGGPAGFLKVLDPSTIGFADLAGNRQYISTGNVSENDRVALILMDFSRQRRLKIWGRARIIHADTEPTLLARLTLPGDERRVERGYVIRLEAFDFNCPQHIVPRYTDDEIAAHCAPLLDELAVLREQVKRLRVA